MFAIYYTLSSLARFFPLLFFFYCPVAPRDLHSFPTRRSSDLLLPYLVDDVADRPVALALRLEPDDVVAAVLDRKSTRLNSCHQIISYAVFCLKKKKKTIKRSK